jgi:hypothetical protein
MQHVQSTRLKIPGSTKCTAALSAGFIFHVGSEVSKSRSKQRA